jgi:hypothetical protein
MLKNASKLLLFILLVVQVGCTTPKKTAMALFHTQEGYVDGGGDVRLFYRLLGAGPDTLVVIHGGPGIHNGLFS